MSGPIARRTVYAATVIAVLALAGGWTLAAGTLQTTGPTQSSSITVTAPTGFIVASVESTQLLSVSGVLITGLDGPAGTQAQGTGHGLNSTFDENVLLTACAGTGCGENFSAVAGSAALFLGDSALQVMLTMNQPTTAAVGFDVQVEIIYNLPAGPNVYAFGNGYFDSNSATTVGTAVFSVGLYVDLGVPSTELPSVSDIVVTMNNCQTATTCP
ncbi:MAG: hypothetical protein L3J92_01445 [Thermoplasmata archaeon]|jgi:hypothetical protein|nr:hypothetical protein [Thermoplasmata archaeon]